ncbi:hypothetical protein ASPZODRAFT_54451, partial [Penicilliopsis zonata CBS 506.65]
HCFFYGTLMDPHTLARVLGVSSRPELHPATVHGFRAKLWGEYPVLLRDESSAEAIHGMAYPFRSLAELRRLAAYETEMYRIEVGEATTDNNGSMVLAYVFVWDGEESLLREGHFDLKDWQL